MNAALLVAAGSLGALAVALILLCRAAEAADKNRADDLMGLADEVQRDDFHLWELEDLRAALIDHTQRLDAMFKRDIGGQR